MSITEAYIKNIPIFPISIVEKFVTLWMKQGNNEVKDELLPPLIDKKLREYEEEY